MRTIRECNKCGCQFFSIKNFPCPNCTGIMCATITPVTGQRLSGTLYRDKTSGSMHEISFTADDQEDLQLLAGLWCGGYDAAWTVAAWQRLYGRLPRKGSKQAVLLELARVQ